MTEEQRQNLFSDRQKIHDDLNDFKALSELKEKQYQQAI